MIKTTKIGCAYKIDLQFFMLNQFLFVSLECSPKILVKKNLRGRGRMCKLFEESRVFYKQVIFTPKLIMSNRVNYNMVEHTSTQVSHRYL